MNRFSVSCFALVCFATSFCFALHPTNDSPPGTPLLPAPHPVPFLTPEEEIKTFKIDPGFHAEVVASEPMVEHPVAMAFDPDGRLWVVEMRGYMPDVNGTGEKKPIGRISILEDTDGDGRMDKSTIFLDNLVLPRAIGLARDGALVAIPPNLYFCRSTKHDDKCDEQTLIANDYGISGNPEHQPNGLMPDLDNWIYNANYGKRFKFVDGKWISDPIPELGQWGITQDDHGRIFHDSNSDQLRVSIVPPAYVLQNPHIRSEAANYQAAKDQTCWPIHDTAVDRGYLPHYMRPDGSLVKFTAACSPLIYRGGIFPSEYNGNAFVCEPSANLIRRDTLTESNGFVQAKNAYPNREFLASTYERFRPVNLYNGPDGSIYVIDMHHGLLQHEVYETTYVIQQYLARQLDKHLMTGRIFRIVPDSAKKFPSPHLSTASIPDLIADLSHPNGWYRDTAQRLLVERADKSSITLLKSLALTSDNPLTRLHALWTLEGMNKLDQPTLLSALSDPDPKNRAAAIRLSEPLLASRHRPEVLPKVLALASANNPDIRLQFNLTISRVGTPESDAALARTLSETATRGFECDAVALGMRGRELEFLDFALKQPGWDKPSLETARAIHILSECVITEANPKRIARLLDIAAEYPSHQLPLLSAFPDFDPKNPRAHKPIILPAESPAMTKLSASTNPKIKKVMYNVENLVHWIGQPGYTPPPPPRPLTAAEQARFDLGKTIYTSICIQCHKADGMGQEGMAPPLVGSEWALGTDHRMARIVLNGLRGPLTVNGKLYNLDMPGLKTNLDDEKIASVLTFIRRSWDNGANPVDPSTIEKIRPEASTRRDPWSERELLTIK